MLQSLEFIIQSVKEILKRLIFLFINFKNCFTNLIFRFLYRLL